MDAAVPECGGDGKAASRSEEAGRLYEQLGSCRLVAKEMGISVGVVAKHLKKLRDARGLSDIRELRRCATSGDSASNAVTASSLMSLAERQGFRCALSGVAITPGSAALDHKVPVSDGGSHDLDNVQWVDRQVNVMKGQISQGEFILLCRRVADHCRG